MRTLVEITAEAPDRGSASRITTLRATGQLAARATAAGTVHLVGTAAGPLGGDQVVLRIDVGPGAELAVRSVAAALVLPGHGDASSVLVEASVGRGAVLDVALEPTIVASGATHHARTTASLDRNATLAVTERVVLGRYGEEAGRWFASTAVERAGVPVLRHDLDLGPGSVIWDSLNAPRSFTARLGVPPADQTPPQVGHDPDAAEAVHLQLAAGGVLTMSMAE